MSHHKTARPVMTGFFWGGEVRVDFDDEDFQPLDACDFVSLGSCFKSYGKPSQTMAARQYMDATAEVTA